MSLVKEEEDSWREKMAKELGASSFEVYSDEHHRDYYTIFYVEDGVVVYFDSTGRVEEFPSPPSWLRELQLIESEGVRE